MINRIGEPGAKEALSTAGRVGDFCLPDARLYKSDAYPPAIRWLAFRLKMPKVRAYALESTEHRAETADPKLLKKTDGKEDR